MTVEFWKSLFDGFAVVLLFLTFVAGAGALITGRIINQRQEATLRQFDADLTKARTDLASQQERAAQAEKQLLDVAQRQAPRFVPSHALSAMLKGKASGTVRIMYQPNDPEAYWYAFSLMGELHDGGWIVPSLPEPIPSDLMPRTPGFTDRDMQIISDFQKRFPDAMRVGVGAGLTILAHSLQEDQPADRPYKVLTGALKSLKLLNGYRMDINLPPDHFVLVVGPKP